MNYSRTEVARKARQWLLKMVWTPSKGLQRRLCGEIGSPERSKMLPLRNKMLLEFEFGSRFYE
jgi:hypothetical protein